MKAIVLSAFFSIVAVQFVNAKGSLSTNEAFKEYRKHESHNSRSDINPEIALSELLKKQDPLPSPEDVLDVLAIIRDAPTKDLIPLLKELWSTYHKQTFRVTEPDDWINIKTEDYAQMLCDEIKRRCGTFSG